MEGFLGLRVTSVMIDLEQWLYYLQALVAQDLFNVATLVCRLLICLLGIPEPSLNC